MKVTGFFGEAEKSITAHPAQSVLLAFDSIVKVT
jgi:hypothetical protein